MVEARRTVRKLAAILAADVAGYSRLMAADEEGTARRLGVARGVIDSAIATHGGRIANTAGDSVLAEFPSAVDAVQCGLSIQSQLAEESGGEPSEAALRFRMGVHVGDVIVNGHDLLGDGVNIAARLEAIAEPGGLCLSDDAYAHVRKVIAATFADLGPRRVKNMVEPVHVYAVRPSRGAVPTAARPAIPSERPSLAVMPFINLGGAAEEDYFADGIVDDITTALGKARWFFVIARNSAFTYKGRAIDARQVGQELGVRYLLEGSVRRAGAQLRISGQLVEATTGRQLWSDRFDGDAADIFDLQDRITTGVAAAIEPNMRFAEIERAQRKPTDQLDAYDRHLRALPPLYRYTQEGFTEAELLLREALACDPAYPDALAALADCRGRMALNGWVEDRRAAFRDAVDLSARAVAADPQNATALATAAWAGAIFGQRFDQALEFAGRALRLFPDSLAVRSYCGWVYVYAGENERAIEQFEAARTMSPVDPRDYFPLLGIASAHFFARRFEESETLCRRILTEVPNHNVARRCLAACLAHEGRIEEARVVIAELIASQPNSNLRASRSTVYRHPWMLDLYVDGLRLAGLPE